MANYLPVLLVSVSTNTVPDDSSMSTLPRGQVDYLSHDWQEEDVWRSWRNMTRQKNEIANGMRLENASWRTWWKQRNKLKTVSPETLNWLKDSDVTWLYGPLHTAVDWSPPPKPKPVPTSVDDKSATSAHDRLDLSMPSSMPKHKPILKYRSISEILTSDFPAPDSSDDEDEEHTSQPPISPSKPTGSTEVVDIKVHKRPVLMHTKSDTHISRWGPNRVYRKDSPPRIDPPGHNPAPPIMRRSQTNGPSRRRHILFNTFVEQCIAIEKPRKPVFKYGGGVGWHFDDSYEEEDSDDAPVPIGPRYPQTSSYGIDESAIGSDSESSSDELFYDDDEDDEDEDDAPLEFNPSARRSSQSSDSNPREKRKRGPLRPPPRQRRGSVYATYSPKTHTVSTPASVAQDAPKEQSRSPKRRISRSQPDQYNDLGLHQHMTIAPIAPTLLKTSNEGEDDEHDHEFGSLAASFGFAPASGRDGRSGLVPPPSFGWRDGFGDDGGDAGSDDGLGGITAVGLRRSNSNDFKRNSKDKARPVDLVYVPSVANQYNDRFPRNGRPSSNGNGGQHSAPVSPLLESHTPHISLSPPDLPPTIHAQISENPVLEQKPAVPVVAAPGAASLGLRDEARGRGRSASGSRSPQITSSSSERQSRSRSRSHSRTPSPVLLSESSRAPTRASEAGPIPVPEKRSDSLSPPSPVSTLLSPPQRGRGATQSPKEDNPRGRSSARTSPSSIEERSRSRSSHGGSPLGSLSPDAGVASPTYSNKVSRSSDSRRVSDRGRDLTKKRLVAVSSATASGASTPTSNQQVEALNTTAVDAALADALAAAPASASASALPSIPANESSTLSGVTSDLDSTPAKPEAGGALKESNASHNEPNSIPLPPSTAFKPSTPAAAGLSRALLAHPPASNIQLPVPVDLATVPHTHSASRESAHTSSPLIPTSPSVSSTFPIILSPPLPAQPSTSYSVSPPRDVETPALPPMSASNLIAPGSPIRSLATVGLGKSFGGKARSASVPTHERKGSADSTASSTSLVGRAVGMAGSLFGLWAGPRNITSDS